MNNCVFCKIVKGEIPAHKVYEGEKSIAFLDINPVNKGHLLVIPKEHYAWLDELPDELFTHLMLKTKKLMSVLKNSFNPQYVQLLVAGEDVPHVHIHLFPRYKGDKKEHWNKEKYSEDEAEKIVEKIRTQIT